MEGDFTPWPVGRGRVGWTEDSNGCHIWNGDRSSGGHGKPGYGRVRYQGRMQLVHRVRYEMEVGPIPTGLELDHYVCDNGAGGCCNPHHCRPVTTRENTLRSDSVSALCRARTHCPRGHPLTPENLDRHRASKGCRACKVCIAGRNAAYKRARREAVARGLVVGSGEFRAYLRAAYAKLKPRPTDNVRSTRRWHWQGN